MKLVQDIIERKIKAHLEPLHAHISFLTQTMDKIIQVNSTGDLRTAHTCELRFQSESPLKHRSGTPRRRPGALITIARYWPDTVTGATRILNRRPPKPQHADMDTNDDPVFPNRNRRADYSQTSD